MKLIKTEIKINAPAEKVWQVLMDHNNYPVWNPFITKISGNPQKGSSLEIEISQNGGKKMKFTPKVLENDENTEFRWLGHLMVKGIFDGEHYFQIQKEGPSTTRFIHGENFTGLFSGLFYKMIGEDTKKGFQAMNQALKKQVETLNA